MSVSLIKFTVIGIFFFFFIFFTKFSIVQPHLDLVLHCLGGGWPFNEYNEHFNYDQSGKSDYYLTCVTCCPFSVSLLCEINLDPKKVAADNKHK